MATTDRKSVMMAFRLANAEVQLIKLAAQMDGRKPRSWMREALLAAARRRIAKAER